MLRTFLFELIRRRYFFAAIALGGLTLFLPRPEGLSPQGQGTLALLVFAVVCFLTDPVPLPAVALLIGVGEVVFGIKSPEAMPRSYMSGAVFFILGSLMIGAALVHQKLDRRIALFLVRFTGTGFKRITLGLSVLAALLASFVGPHVVAATLMPVALVLVRRSGAPPEEEGKMARTLLVALAYSAALGGFGTLSGSARNAIMMEYLRSRPYGIHVDYLDWIRLAYPLLLVTAPLIALVSIWTFRPAIRDLSQAVTSLKEESDRGKGSAQAWLSGVIVLLTLVGFFTLGKKMGIGTIAVLGATLFLVTGLVTWEQLDKGVNWGVVLLYAAAISLGISMSETGAAQWLARTVLDGLAPLGFRHGLPLLFVVGLLTMLTANVMSGGPSVSVIGPVVLALGALSGGDVALVGLMCAAGSSFSYFTIMANPANSIVYSSGWVHPRDFLRTGWKMALLSMFLVLVLAGLYWPLFSL